MLVPTRQIQVKHRVMLLMQDTMFPAQPKRVKLPVQLERSAPVQDQFRALTLLQGTMFHPQVNRVQPHAVLVPTKHHRDKDPAMLPMRATTFLARPKRRKRLVD